MADQKDPIAKSKDDKGNLVIDYRQIGATGLRRFSGFIYEDFLVELIGWKAMAVYKEMGDNDSIVGAFLYAIDHICRKVPWRVDPASTSPNDVEAAEFLEQCMDDMDQTWIDTISEILSFIQYGHSLHEIVYKRRCGDGFDPSMRSKYTDGRIGWRGLPIRSQDTLYRWQFDDHGGIQGVQQLAPPHYYNVVIPAEKFLLFRTSTHKNNPEGKSVLRSAYRSWYMKKNIENIEAIGIERDLAGFPVMKVPAEIMSAGASAEQQAIMQELKKMVTNIRRDEQEGALIPSDTDANGKDLYTLELLTTGGNRQFDTNKIVQRYDQRIAMSVLADFLMLGHDGAGSLALANSKTNMFARPLGSFLDIVAQIFNRFAVPRLFALNDFQISDYPKIVHGDTENVDLKDIGDYIQKLAAAGMPMFPNEELEKHLLKTAHLPEVISQANDVDQQVEPTHMAPPTSITEIPDNPVQMPTGSINDRTPADGKPPVNTVTNASGNTERVGTMVPPNKSPSQNTDLKTWGL